MLYPECQRLWTSLPKILIQFFCMFHWLTWFFKCWNIEKKMNVPTLKNAAWAYAWAGVNTGMDMRVHVRVQLFLHLWGPQSLAHCQCTILSSPQNVWRHLWRTRCLKWFPIFLTCAGSVLASSSSSPESWRLRATATRCLGLTKTPRINFKEFWRLISKKCFTKGNNITRLSLRCVL